MTIHLKEKDKVLVMSHRPCVICSPLPWANYMLFGCPVPNDRLAHCIFMVSLRAVIFTLLFLFDSGSIASAWHLIEAHYLLSLDKGV